MDKISLPAPAKINLILNVLGKRSDGYHELETIMHQISLIDIIHIELKEENITVESNCSLIPNSQDNLAWKAAALFMEEAGIKAGVKIFIEKNIPVGAGLAGGSTDAAAVLSGLNRLFRLELSTAYLEEIGTVIGSDVPFCLSNVTALARGRGELLTPVAKGPKLNLVIVVPEFQISTAEVYSDYKLENSYHLADTAAFIKAWESCDIISIASHLGNGLETVSTQKHVEIDIIKDDLKRLGAVNALMSGSGPAVFGIFPDHNTALKAISILQISYRQVYHVTSYYRE